ncbi:hypothetical protein PPM_p0236 (plasmid) [Paenibacillus polymyxa M1]|uniref:hypothetical protein n=2 Tax=Paenibacillus polymyxa TaxID=1406 RepID=UPI00021BBA76|nr:hypothetical protein [Paenibacillus polymyxa]CCC86386.1 hypothetical protein PPM_p0236 [Paenibacillus polymyxa M1]
MMLTQKMASWLSIDGGGIDRTLKLNQVSNVQDYIKKKKVRSKIMQGHESVILPIEYKFKNSDLQAIQWAAESVTMMALKDYSITLGANDFPLMNGYTMNLENSDSIWLTLESQGFREVLHARFELNKFNLTEALYALEIPTDTYFGKKQKLLLRFDVRERKELLIIKKSLSILAYQRLVREPHGDLFAQELESTYKDALNDLTRWIKGLNDDSSSN